MNGPVSVAVNRHVELELTLETGERERLGLDIVPDAAADFEHGFLGESTPLAQAIMGQPSGSQVAYSAGDIRKVTILTVDTLLHGRPVDLSEKRAETEQKAIDSSNRASAIIFASAVNNKWGDYDPGALLEDEEDDQPPDPHK